jgi:tetratricopeptide (TPR) repeat protein
MHISSRKLGVSGFCLIMLMLALPAMAQTRMIKGKVTDDKDQPVVGASVTIQSVEIKRISYSVKTNKKGEYVQVGLPTGTFYIIVRAQGFSPNYVTVKPAVGEETVVNLVLASGPDAKLSIEMTAQEIEQAKKEIAKQEKVQQSSTEVQSMFDAGRRLAAEEKHLEAIEEFKKALEKNSEQANVLAYMAESYSKLDKNAEALECYQKAVVINPKDANIYTNMGVLLGKMGKNAESQEAFNKAIAINPSGAAQGHFNIGVILFNDGHMAEAAEAFKKAIAADANYAEAYYHLGMSLSGNQDTMQDAVKAFQQYIKIGKKSDQIQVAKEIITTLEESLKKK